MAVAPSDDSARSTRPWPVADELLFSDMLPPYFTLVNTFLGEDRMATKAIREGDDQGRHTTSHRQLILLPGGQLLLDTPGVHSAADAVYGPGILGDQPSGGKATDVVSPPASTQSDNVFANPID